MKPANVKGRWNIEQDGDDLLVCFNMHDKGEKCEYQRFVPESSVAAERERCAKVCDSYVDAEIKTGKVDHNEIAWAFVCALAIRRGK
jgi:hypothetical protein